MICSKCGKELVNGEKFCDECGTNVEHVYADLYDSNSFRQNEKKPMSVAGWIGRSFIQMIPFIGGIVYLIMLFVWAGDKSREESFNNWAKAQLWLMLIGIIVLVVIIVIATSIGISSFNDISSAGRVYY